ncbi:hypothetical protein MELB17_03365 [Marinobacter sp. ELB17]|nr:hypothetical protein MELB17_03365 [Marinobacter sp. ELB17]
MNDILKVNFKVKTFIECGLRSIWDLGDGTGNKINHGRAVPFRSTDQAADLTALAIKEQSRWDAFYTKGCSS